MPSPAFWTFVLSIVYFSLHLKYPFPSSTMSHLSLHLELTNVTLHTHLWFTLLQCDGHPLLHSDVHEGHQLNWYSWHLGLEIIYTL